VTKPLSQHIFNISMAENTTIIKPDRMLNDFWWETVMLVHFWRVHAQDCRRM